MRGRQSRLHLAIARLAQGQREARHVAGQGFNQVSDRDHANQLLLHTSDKQAANAFAFHCSNRVGQRRIERYGNQPTADQRADAHARAVGAARKHFNCEVAIL